MLKEISDEEIIEGILKNDNRMVRYIYKKYYGKIKSMVRTFRNISLNPDDIFQEGLTRAIMNIRHGKFEGRSSFYTYLTGICRNICLKELRVTKEYELKEQHLHDGDDEMDYDMIKLVLHIKDKLDQKCKEIINLRFRLKASNDSKPESNKNMQFEEIAVLLGIQPANARQRFKRCLEKLSDFVTSNPLYQELAMA